jgi:hypothetical protein
VNLLSLSLRNPRRLIFAWLRCMGASARESRVSVAIYSLDVVGHPGLHQSGITSLCFVGCFSPGPRRNDLTIYWALGPFVRSFTPLVDPGDIYPPQVPYQVQEQLVRRLQERRLSHTVLRLILTNSHLEINRSSCNKSPVVVQYNFKNADCRDGIRWKML